MYKLLSKWPQKLVAYIFVMISVTLIVLFVVLVTRVIGAYLREQWIEAIFWLLFAMIWNKVIMVDWARFQKGYLSYRDGGEMASQIAMVIGGAIAEQIEEHEQQHEKREKGAEGWN